MFCCGTWIVLMRTATWPRMRRPHKQCQAPWQQKFEKLWLINTGIKLNFWARSVPIPGSLMPREECPRWLHAYEQKWAFLKGLSIGSSPEQLFVSLLSSKGVELWGLFGFLVGFFDLVVGVCCFLRGFFVVVFFYFLATDSMWFH